MCDWNTSFVMTFHLRGRRYLNGTRKIKTPFNNRVAETRKIIIQLALTKQNTTQLREYERKLL